MRKATVKLSTVIRTLAYFEDRDVDVEVEDVEGGVIAHYAVRLPLVDVAYARMEVDLKLAMGKAEAELLEGEDA